MAQKSSSLPLPAFFDPRNAQSWHFDPDKKMLQAAAADWASQYDIRPAVNDTFRLHVVNIDNQLDFTHPNGTLFAAGRSGCGALDDSIRAAKFCYRNAHLISDWTDIFDTHLALQVFTPAYLIYHDGTPVPEHTLIEPEDAIRKRVLPHPAMAALAEGIADPYDWVCKAFVDYNKQLAKAGKYKLYIWPWHTQLGSRGHCLNPLIYEARFFLSCLRKIQSHVELKGMRPFSERFSAYHEEVTLAFDGTPIGYTSTQLLEKTIFADATVLFGQAGSHCLPASVDSVLAKILEVDPRLAGRIYVLTDCTSAVVTPQFDFTDRMQQAFDRYANAGINLVKSTDPIESWPGIIRQAAA